MNNYINLNRETLFWLFAAIILILFASCSCPVEDENLSEWTIIRGRFDDCIYDKFVGEYFVMLDEYMDYVSEFSTVHLRVTHAGSGKWGVPILWSIDYILNQIIIDDRLVPYESRDKYFYRIEIIERKW